MPIRMTEEKEEAYAKLRLQAQGASPAQAAVDQFLAPMPEGSLDAKAVARRLAASASEWAEE